MQKKHIDIFLSIIEITFFIWVDIVYLTKFYTVQTVFRCFCHYLCSECCDFVICTFPCGIE